MELLGKLTFSRRSWEPARTRAHRPRNERPHRLSCGKDVPYHREQLTKRNKAGGKSVAPLQGLGVHGLCASRRKPSWPEKWRPTFSLTLGAKNVRRHKSDQIKDLCLEAPAPGRRIGAFAPSKKRHFPPFFSVPIPRFQTPLSGEPSLSPRSFTAKTFRHRPRLHKDDTRTDAAALKGHTFQVAGNARKRSRRGLPSVPTRPGGAIPAGRLATGGFVCLHRTNHRVAIVQTRGSFAQAARDRVAGPT